MKEDKIVYVEAASVADDLFDRFYHEVLEQSFPSEELEDIQAVRDAYHRPEGRVSSLIALYDGEPVGGALGDYYPAGNVVLLSYLAMRADWRGKGLGAALLGRAVGEWQESAAPTVVVAEVEDPRHRTGGPYMDSAARLRFYERAGAKLVPIAYFQPSVGHGSPRVRGMFLICLDSWRQTVPRDAILAFLDEYMELAEGAQARLADPEYLALRGQVESQPDDIPLWPLSRAGEVTWLPRPCFPGASRPASVYDQRQTRASLQLSFGPAWGGIRGHERSSVKAPGDARVVAWHGFLKAPADLDHRRHWRVRHGSSSALPR